MTWLDYLMFLLAFLAITGLFAANCYDGEGFQIRVSVSFVLIVLFAVAGLAGLAGGGFGVTYVPSSEALRLLATSHPKDTVLASIPVNRRDYLWVRDSRGTRHIYVARGDTAPRLIRLTRFSGRNVARYYRGLFRDALLLRFPQAQRKLKLVEAQHGTAFWVSGKPYPAYVWLKHPVCPSDAGTVVPGPPKCARRR